MNNNGTKTNSIAFVRRNWHILIVLSVTFVAASWLAYINRHMLNPDAISYIQVAKYYSDFNISHAINGYWAPLISWLLVPAVWLGIDPQYAFRGINILLTMLAVGVFLFVLNREGRPTAAQKTLQAIFVGGVGLAVATWSGFLVTPDVLTAVVTLLALLSLDRYLTKPSVRLAILAGVLLAAVYFAKSIGFYISSVLIGFVVIGTWIRTKSFALPRTHLVLAASFLALVAPWIAAISFKYDKPAVSTAGSYNFALIGPTAPPHPQVVPNTTLVPHYETDVWAWDDPSYLTMPTWNISSNTHYYLSHLTHNIPRTTTMLVGITPLVAIGLYAAIRYRRDQFSILTMLVTALTICAYGAIIVEDRHLWAAALLLLFCAIYYLRREPHTSRALTYLSVALLVFYTVPMYIATAKDTSNTAKTSNAARALSISARTAIPQGSIIAGGGLREFFCYYTHTSCHGYYVITEKNAEEAISAMRSGRMQYYIEFNAPRNVGLSVIYTETRGVGTPASLTIYKL